MITRFPPVFFFLFFLVPGVVQKTETEKQMSFTTKERIWTRRKKKFFIAGISSFFFLSFSKTL